MEKVTLGISGMTCGGCVRSVGNVLNALDGVAKAEVSLEKKNAVVEYDPGKVQVEQLKRSVVEAGFEVAA
ncbi:MAG: heavy-metal-associated domain-containing protein [Burkholderiales bacterium]|nr:heavy-metal-associated domain-containing protein [Burkholderiales bacterium]